MKRVLVATVAIDGDQAAVWSVNLGVMDGPQQSRLTGAWVMHTSRVSSLHIWPDVVGVLGDDSEVSQLDELLSKKLLRIDQSAVLHAMSGEVAILDAAYKARVEASPKSTQLIAPTWPMIPDVPDALSKHQTGLDLVNRALTRGHWLAHACRLWEQIEEQRLARNYMRSAFGANYRPLPLRHQ